MNIGKQTAHLQVDFLNYWHVGSGRGGGHFLDAVCERDDDGLPVLPGRQLKGLLRHALFRAEAWGWLEGLELPPGPVTSHEGLIFGSRSHGSGRFATWPGMLVVDSAHLPDAERRWLALPEQSQMRGALFEALFSTAIDELGSARRYSLRGLEVCVPLSLRSGLALEASATEDLLRAQQRAYVDAGTGWAALQAALPLLDAFGAQRSRGLGEARVSLICNAQGG